MDCRHLPAGRDRARNRPALKACTVQDLWASGGKGAAAGKSVVGASRPLRRIPAIVSFLNPQPALSLVGGNRSSCLNTDIRKECGVGAACAALVRITGK